MKHDVLFLTWNCPECARLKAEFEKFSKHVFEDEASGKQGQHLVIIQTYSNVAARYALENLGGFKEEEFTPALRIHDNKKITDPDEIIKYLKDNFK